MLAVNWSKLLALFLWVSPHALLGVLAVVLCKRRLYREFPCFVAYVFYEIAQFVLLFTLYSIDGVGQRYAYAYCATLLLSIALRFGVIEEVCKDLFRESRFLKVSARRLLLSLQVPLIIMGILLTVYAPGGKTNRFTAGIFLINRGAAVVQGGLLLALLLFSRFLGLSWRRSAFGIALGLAVLTSLDLATFALRAAFTTDAARGLLNLFITGAYLICVLIWIGYLLVPESELASLTIIPHDEVETWNTELQRLLEE